MSSRDGTDKLVHSARANGRCLEIISYFDGATPIRATVVFNTWQEAAEAARVLSAANLLDECLHHMGTTPSNLADFYAERTELLARLRGETKGER